MNQRKLKLQAVVFGGFNFPADAATTMKLMAIFAPLDFIPQVMSVPDPMAGGLSQRMALTKGDMQVVFSPDRIDFTTIMPSRGVEEFVSDVASIVDQLENFSLKFNRVALVIDEMLEELSSDDSKNLLAKLLPNSEPGAIEWTARWVTPCDYKDEQFNVCFEAIKVASMMMISNGQMHPLNGVKVMYDVSTTPLEINFRFDSKNLREKLNDILKLISDRTHLTKI